MCRRFLFFFSVVHNTWTFWHFPLENDFFEFDAQRCLWNEAQRLNDFKMAVVLVFIPAHTFESISCTCDTHTYSILICPSLAYIHTDCFSSNFYSVVSQMERKYSQFNSDKMIFNRKLLYFQWKSEISWVFYRWRN